MTYTELEKLYALFKTQGLHGGPNWTPRAYNEGFNEGVKRAILALGLAYEREVNEYVKAAIYREEIRGLASTERFNESVGSPSD